MRSFICCLIIVAAMPAAFAQKDSPLFFETVIEPQRPLIGGEVLYNYKSDSNYLQFQPAFSSQILYLDCFKSQFNLPISNKIYDSIYNKYIHFAYGKTKDNRRFVAIDENDDRKITADEWHLFQRDLSYAFLYKFPISGREYVTYIRTYIPGGENQPDRIDFYCHLLCGRHQRATYKLDQQNSLEFYIDDGLNYNLAVQKTQATVMLMHRDKKGQLLPVVTTNYKVADTFTFENKHYSIIQKKEKWFLRQHPSRAFGQEVGFVAENAPLNYLYPDTNKTTNLYAIKKIKVLDFWGTWCVPCLQVQPRVDSLYKTLDTARFAPMSICYNKSRLKGYEHIVAKELSGDHFFVSKDASPSENNIVKVLNVNGYPTFMVIDETNRVVFRAEDKPGFKKLLIFLSKLLR